MAQLFPKWTNWIPLGAALVAPPAMLLAVGGVSYYGSPRYTDVGYRPEQPVPYSHALHVGDLGLDCRYCHVSVEKSPVANIPPTKTCMNCHQVVAREAASLEPVRASMASGRPIEWVRVHDLPDYAYFHHAVHVRAGIGCVSCHGRIDQMVVVQQVEPLSMSWCLDCHRNPAPHLRPTEEVTNMNWIPSADHAELAAKMIEDKSLHPPTECWGCHR